MEGDGGLTAFTTPAAGVVKGLVELTCELYLAERFKQLLTACRAGAARKRALCGREVFVVGHGIMRVWGLIMRRALTSSPFAFAVAALAEALYRIRHVDRLEGDDFGDGLQVVRRVLHGAAPLGEAWLLVRHRVGKLEGL
jgi:hypothetical protein